MAKLSALTGAQQLGTADAEWSVLGSMTVAGSMSIGTTAQVGDQNLAAASIKNLYNSSEAENGKIYSFGSGNTSVYADGMILGRQPVAEGRTYTWSMPASGPGFQAYILSWDAGNTYLGATPNIASGWAYSIPPMDVALSDSNKTITFTIPDGSGISKVSVQCAYSTHTVEQYTAVIAGMQFEEGSAKSSYVTPLTYTDPKTAVMTIPSSVGHISMDQAPITVVKDGLDVYVRTYWTSSLDLVQKLTTGHGSIYTNNISDFEGVKTISSSTADANTVTAYSSGALIASQGDDAAPVNYNGTYIGANHGPNFILEVTTTSTHGKTVADIGSEWTDGSGRKWYIMSIRATTKLWVMSENIGASAALWNFETSIAGTLTHSSNATHTDSFSVSSATLTQLANIIQNRTLLLLLDGRTRVSRDNVYYCDKLDIVNNYDIPNVSGILDYVKSRVGASIAPLFNDSAIAKQVRMGITYRFGSNGSCSIYHTLRTYQDVTLNYVGFTQGSAVNYGSDKIWNYVPKVEPIVGSLKTWDFEQLEDITSQVELIHFLAASWTDADNPPERMAQIVKTAGGTPQFGFMIGFSQLRGIGVPATRKTFVNDAGFIHVSKKQYPYGIDGTVDEFVAALVPANSVYECVAYRSFFNYSDATDASVYTWYWDGDDVVVVVDYHSTVTAKQLPLPKEFIGRSITTVDKSASCTLLSSEYVSSDGLYISISGGYGYGVFKLSK